MHEFLQIAHPFFAIDHVRIDPAELLTEQQSFAEMVAEIRIVVALGTVGIPSEQLNVACINGGERGNVVARRPDPRQKAVKRLYIRLGVGLGEVELVIGLLCVDRIHQAVVAVRPITAAAGQMGVGRTSAGEGRNRGDLVKVDAVDGKLLFHAARDLLDDAVPAQAGRTHRNEPRHRAVALFLRVDDIERRAVGTDCRAVFADRRKVFRETFVCVVHFPADGVDVREQIKPCVPQSFCTVEERIAGRKKVRVVDVERDFVPVVDMIADGRAECFLQRDRRIHPIVRAVAFGDGCKRHRARFHLLGGIGNVVADPEWDFLELPRRIGTTLDGKPFCLGMDKVRVDHRRVIPVAVKDLPAHHAAERKRICPASDADGGEDRGK